MLRLWLLRDASHNLVAKVARALGIDHGGFDLAEVRGHWYFIELNTRFGSAAINRAGIDLSARIVSYLRENSSPYDQPRDPPLRCAL